MFIGICEIFCTLRILEVRGQDSCIQIAIQKTLQEDYKETNEAIPRETFMGNVRCYTTVVISILLLVTLMMMILVFNPFMYAAKIL